LPEGTYQLGAIKAAAKAASIDFSVMEFRDSFGWTRRSSQA